MQKLSIAICTLLAVGSAAPVLAQDPAVVEALAPLMMAGDRRAYDGALFAQSLGHPDEGVRRFAAMTIGRIGDRRGTPLLVTALKDQNRAVVTDAIFALGLLQDTSAVGPILARLRDPDTLATDAAAEAASALSKIGGEAAARFLSDVLATGAGLSRERRAAMVPNALLESWRMGKLASIPAILPYASDTSVDLRWRSIYALARLRAPEAANVILRGIRDDDAMVRETAAKALTRAFADSGQLPARTVLAELGRAFDDTRPGVRINALAAAATWRDSALSSRAIRLLSDPDANVRVQAVVTLGETRGEAALVAIDGVFDRRDASWAMRRAALTALARADTARFARRALGWTRSNDVRERIAALEGWGTARPSDDGVFRAGIVDADPRVQAAALEAWRTARGRADSAIVDVARGWLRERDSDLRGAALGVIRRGATLGDLDAVMAAWRAGGSDTELDARLAALAVLSDLARRTPDLVDRLSDPARRWFLERPAESLLRAAASRDWPALAERWGPAWPVETGRSLEDYRGVVRTFLLAKQNPKVILEVEGKGSVELELLAREAPLTVANFLRLVDRRYFDGNRWHRVVPNFVVQDGDRTGTGNGGPGWAIRDEINRERYSVPMLGMALSGPDTGGSQWFINLSAQPHLDGRYTIFGRVSGSYATLPRIVQGDVIRSIHR
ncbi:MAG: peptidylprolyl isomerase [Gemmatimonadota bacterium]